MVKSGSFGLAFCLDQNSLLFSYNSMYYTYTGQEGDSLLYGNMYIVQHIKTSFLVHYILCILIE